MCLQARMHVTVVSLHSQCQHVPDMRMLTCSLTNAADSRVVVDVQAFALGSGGWAAACDTSCT